MIKSFFKKVFSSTDDYDVTADTLIEEGNNDSVTLIVSIQWIDQQAMGDFDQTVKILYNQMVDSHYEFPPRIKLKLADAVTQFLQTDRSLRNQLSEYLSLCEQEIQDLTFFLDKNDEETRNIYKTFLLPQQEDEQDAFLLQRCMMIYETSESLSVDYCQEVELLFTLVDRPLNEEFFERFEKWKDQVLNARQYEEENIQQQNNVQVNDSDVEMIQISKEEIENENLQQIDRYMAKVLSSPEQSKRHQGQLLFSFYGFSKNSDLLDLMNHDDIKNWAANLVERHPYIFYYLNNEHYPMTSFLTSLVVSTEVEENNLYYNEEELAAFQIYIQDSLCKLAEWIGEDQRKVLDNFNEHFQ
jgi:hypothetical protein